jgi:aerobic carbon-monoxide dehydrogenase medium subunit
MAADPFDYHVASTLEQASELLAALGDDAKLVAGGQSLIPFMTLRLARPQHLVDISRIDVAPIGIDAGDLVIPALTRHATLAHSDLVRSRMPLLAEAASLVGNPRIRHRGTLGGSLAHGEATAELATACLALGAHITTLRAGARQTRPVDGLFTGYLTTDLASDEIIESVRIPLREAAGQAFSEVVRRASDYAVVGVAAQVQLTGGGQVADVGLALAGVDDRPRRIDAAALLGQQITDATARAFAEDVAAHLDPPSDVHGTSAYKLRLVRTLIPRTLLTAAARSER